MQQCNKYETILEVTIIKFNQTVLKEKSNGYLLGNLLRDSLILLDVSGGRDGVPLSPGVGNNLLNK